MAEPVDPVLRLPELSRREIEVLRAWLQALSKEDAAEVLFISPSTVSTHIARIRAKYGAVGRPARSKISLMVRALQDGYVTIHDF
ncbi:LuxR family transcriptional regulator [Tsukamurella pseudospumae]|uniref:LuxR family transcriptional regulator n=1 Tax=Tsukamurella pseudospumae TaxID=239498 RepID=A0A138A190_9ACTN|nr:LuxR family transcriptional regulator [Tsukamurella pseudospumae]